METFEELQTLWQQQQPAESPDASALMRALRRHGRKVALLFAAKSVVLLAMLAWLASLGHSRLCLSGVIVVGVGLASFLAMDWASQTAFMRLEFAAPSTDFVRTAIARLRRMENPLPIQKALILICPIVGLNLFFAGFSAETGAARLWMHLGGSLPALAGFWLGFRLRRLRFRKEFQPLIDRLEAFL